MLVAVAPELRSTRSGSYAAQSAAGQVVMQRTVFSSDELDARLDDRERSSLWRDVYATRYGGHDIGNLTDRPFAARSLLAEFGLVGLVSFRGTVSHFSRTPQQVSRDARGGFMLGFNCGPSAFWRSQHGDEAVVDPGQSSFFRHSEAREVRFKDENAWIGLYLPQAPLLELVTHAEDLVCTVLDASLPAARHLRRYMEFLAQSSEVDGDAALSEHAGGTLLDLAALSLGAAGEAAELAKMRGLRAVRINEILASIRKGFADQAFSARDVATKLRLSPRYIQDLLQLIKLWLRVPIEERDGGGGRRMSGGKSNKQGTPQGGVGSARCWPTST
jgi:hypothetical protein